MLPIWKTSMGKGMAALPTYEFHSEDDAVGHPTMEAMIPIFGVVR